MEPPDNLILISWDEYEIVTTHPAAPGRHIAAFIDYSPNGNPIFEINGTDVTIPWEMITSLQPYQKR